MRQLLWWYVCLWEVVDLNSAKELIVALLALIPVCAVPRAIYCVYKWKSDEEQGTLYRKRLINLLIFIGIAEGISAFLYVTLDYLT